MEKMHFLLNDSRGLSTDIYIHLFINQLVYVSTKSSVLKLSRMSPLYYALLTCVLFTYAN